MPFVFEVRDLWPEAIIAVGMMKENIIIRFFKWVARQLYRRAAVIVTVGEGYKQQIIRWYGIAPEKIQVIPNGVLAETFLPGSRLAARTQLGLKPDAFYVIYMGTHGLAHGLDVVLEAARMLEKTHPDIHFLFIGEGAEKKHLQKTAPSCCHFYDQQPKDKVPLWYDAADVALVVLKKDPLFDGTVLSKLYEAMAMEKPIICNVAGECAGIIEKAHAGIVVPPEDARALKEAVLRCFLGPQPEMGKSARKYVIEHYDRRLLAQRYAALLKKMGS